MTAKQKQIMIHTKATKPKPVKSKPKAKPKETKKAKEQKEQPQINLSDFSLSTSIDANRIQIVCSYQGQAIHVYRLAAEDYARYQRSTYQQKFNYFLQRTQFESFGNNGVIVQIVLTSIIELIDKIFAKSRLQRRL
jgi:hypothetical protein